MILLPLYALYDNSIVFVIAYAFVRSFVLQSINDCNGNGNLQTTKRSNGQVLARPSPTFVAVSKRPVFCFRHVQLCFILHLRLEFVFLSLGHLQNKAIK